MDDCASHLWIPNPLNGGYRICPEIRNVESANSPWSEISG